MTPIWQGLLTNLAVVALFNTLWMYGEEIAGGWSLYRRQFALGLLMGVGTVLVMMLPVELGDGIRIDARTSLVATSAFFGGPVAGSLTTAIGIFYRISSGGEGVAAGCLNIVIALVIGVAGRRLLGNRPVRRRHVIGLAVVAGICGTIGC